MIEQIKKFIKESDTTLAFDDEYDDTYVSFTTRENGDVGEEEYSEIDLQDALLMKKAIEIKFPDVQVEVETVDEWVNLEVTIKKEEDAT